MINFLKFKCLKGLKDKQLESREYLERLDYELNVINNMGFCEYFLIVADVVNWANSQRIMIGPGRGSAAGSLASYLLGITQVDPIKYKLYFERFLNPGRISCPDIDIDVEETERTRVIDYLRTKYGEDCVAHIGTYGTLKAKGAVRVAAKLLGHPYQIGDKLANLVLNPIAGKPQPLSICYEKVPALAMVRESNSAEAEILKIAEEIEDRPRSFGTHASGVLIAPEKISRILPLSQGKDGVATSQFDMGIVEELGLVKFDFLGLRALSTIQQCLKLIQELHGTVIDINKIPTDDEAVFANLRSGDNVGIFQMEASSGIRDLLLQVQPTCIEDLSTIIAIFRPGPLGSNMVTDFLKVRAGQAKPSYLVDDLKPILQETGGMIIFQEQVLEICKEIAGYTLSEADIMRKTIGKKIPELMKQQEEKFKQGAIERGHQEEPINKLWQQIVDFALYSFNKAHSISYCFISYQMAYLKTHYPLEFMCACLTADGDERDKVISYISECKRINIPVLQPDINKSDKAFTIKDGRIRFGLSSIKHVGDKSAQSIMEERIEQGPFKDFLDFTQRMDTSRINRLKLEALIWTGCFESLGHKQEDLLNSVESICSYKGRTKAYENRLETYNKRLELYKERERAIEEWENTPRKERVGKKKPNRVKLPEPPEPLDNLTIQSGTTINRIELLSKERELLGFFVSGHPLELTKLQSKYTIQDIKDLSDGMSVEVVAIPSILKELTTKKKMKMAYLDIEDRTGTIQTTVFPTVYQEIAEIVKETIPIKFTGIIESIEMDDEGRSRKITKLIIRDAVPDLTLKVVVENPVKQFKIEDIKKLSLKEIQKIIKKEGKIDIKCSDAIIKVQN